MSVFVKIEYIITYIYGSILTLFLITVSVKSTFDLHNEQVTKKILGNKASKMLSIVVYKYVFVH